LLHCASPPRPQHIHDPQLSFGQSWRLLGRQFLCLYFLDVLIKKK